MSSLDPPSLLSSNDLVRQLEEEHGGVELWADDDHPNEDRLYYWVMTRTPRATRCVAYLRTDRDRIQRRTYDRAGEEIWVDVDAG